MLKKTNYLKRVIESRGLQKKFVAKKIGILPQRLSEYLSGDRKMKPEVAKRIAKLLNISEDSII
jgi:transcriptional regulator with XRE-family HTH domain